MEAQINQGSSFLTTITQAVSSFFVFLSQLLVIVILIFIANKIVSKLFFINKLKKALEESNYTYLLIKISPRNEQKEDALEDFLRALHRILPNNTHFSLEIASSEQFLRFYVVFPKHYKSVFESQLYAQYPEAEIEETKDYLPNFEENYAIAEMTFKKSSIYPLNTYRNLSEDLLRSLSAILSKTEVGEQVIIQLVLKRIGSKIWERGLRGIIFKMSGNKSKERDTPTSSYAKFSQDLYEGSLRIAYVVKDATTANSKLNVLLGLFKSLKGEDNELKRRKLLLGNLRDSFRARLFESGDFWIPAEVATIYHFPYKGAVVSNVVITTSKRAPAPDILPKEGLVKPEEVSFIGTTTYRNENKIFGTKRLDRRRHLYIVGKTGTGKSKLLELLLISDILGGYGCCLLDPHGDLAEEILKYIPQNRIKDVVYVNPADKDYPIGFNPLEPVEDYEIRQHLSTFFIAIFKKLFAASWNQRMEHLIRYITLALLETPDSNILGISRMLSDTSFRQRVIMQIKDPVVKSFWTTEFSVAAEQYSREAVVPILNKVGQFAANPIVRNMVGQKKNALNFEKFMDEGNIVILNISKGKLGDDNTALLGSMFITKIQQAALARAKIPEDQRRDFYFYVDEFQNFATEAFSSILSEARKYHLDLTIAHQYIAQLPEDVKATAFGNVGTLIVFAVGGDDATYLSKEFAPIFSPEDLISVNNREMYIKMSIDGKITPPFSARTLDVPKPQSDFTNQILSHSRLTYGKNRVSVENEIRRWSEVTQTISTSSKLGEFPEPII